MKRAQILHDLISAKIAEYRELNGQAKPSSFEITDKNLSRMPLLLFYFSLAFLANLIFNYWLDDTPIAVHDWVFSGVTLLYWVLFLGCYLNTKISYSIKKLVYSSFLLLANIYLMIFIGMEIIIDGTIYNYLLGMFIIAILPLLSPLQSLMTVTADMVFAIILANHTGNVDFLVQFIVGSSMFSVIISWKEYYSFIRIKSVHQRLQNLSEHDKLTGLYNRNILDSHVAKLWDICAQKKQPLIAAMIDIDYFKNYNDTYGHLLGDRCLEKVAECIIKNNSSELTMRYGGEEFLVFFTGNDTAAVTRILEDIQQRIAALDIAAGDGSTFKKLTVSMGIAQALPGTKTSVDTLINAADQQLYRAKESGRNCICSERT